nr:peptidase m23 [uncultured bacterium]
MIAVDVRTKSISIAAARWSLLIVAAAILVGCSTPSKKRAPIVERGVEMRKPAVAAPTPTRKPVVIDVPTQVYVVQKGDTMYSIAFVNGVDYREVAELNDIDNPSAIQIGQQLRIPVSSPTKSVESAPVIAPSSTPPGGIKSQPKAGKIPYSEKALAQADRMQDERKESVVVAPAKTESKYADDEEGLEWGMPSSGKVIAGFSESANRKGVDIAGKRGQPVVASAPGKVVYSGSGLRGYGKLVIIKHNKTFLSAYAHNDQVLVKEGQSVSKGQKIGEMGNTDADQVKLHFEIRKFGKPVDPAQYLPLIKS